MPMHRRELCKVAVARRDNDSPVMALGKELSEVDIRIIDIVKDEKPAETTLLARKKGEGRAGRADVRPARATCQQCLHLREEHIVKWPGSRPRALGERLKCVFL